MTWKRPSIAEILQNVTSSTYQYKHTRCDRCDTWKRPSIAEIYWLKILIFNILSSYGSGIIFIRLFSLSSILCWIVGTIPFPIKGGGMWDSEQSLFFIK